MKISKKSVFIILAFFSIYVIWGSTFLLNKIVVAELCPFFVASIRFILSGILVFVVVKITGHNFLITKKQFLNCIIGGFLFLVYGNGVFIWALKYVDTGLAAIVASSQPLFVLLFMRLIDHKKIQKKSLTGVFLGILGMYLLVSQSKLTSNNQTMLGLLMILTCVLALSYGSVFVAKADLPRNLFVSITYQMISAGMLLVILSLVFNETWISPMHWSVEVKWSVVLLIIFGGIVAFTAFNYLLKEVSTEKVSTSTFVNPVIALILGRFVLGEDISLQTLIAAFMLLLGVYFIISRKKTKTQSIGN